MFGYQGIIAQRAFASPGSVISYALFYPGVDKALFMGSGYDIVFATDTLFRLDLDVLNATFPVTAKLQCAQSGFNPSTTDMIPVGATVATFDANASQSLYYRVPANTFAQGSIINLVPNGSGGGPNGSFWEALVKVRPYMFPGWKLANLTAPLCLTDVEPGIIGTPQGRAAAASSYANEVTRAKDAIASRLLAAGIDLEALPTDGVQVLPDSTVQLNPGWTTFYPQRIATNLIPELTDAATYLVLALLHERWMTRPDDWDAMRAEYFRGQFEDALEAALRFLPINVNKDWQQAKTEINPSPGRRLVM